MAYYKNTFREYVISISLILVIIQFLYDSIISKTQASETSTISVFIVLLPFVVLILSSKNAIIMFGSYFDLVPLLCLIFLYIIMGQYSYVIDNDGSWIRQSIYLVMIFVSYSVGSGISMEKLPFRFLFIPILLLVLFSSAWVIQFNESSAFGFAITKNVVIGLLAHLIFFMSFVYKKTDTIFIYACIAIAILSVVTSQRFFIPASLFAVIFFIITKYVGINIFSKIFIFSACIFFGVVFFLFVSNINYNPDLYYINQISIDYTGRRFNSGREELWHTIMIYLQDHIWLGFGPGVTPGDIFATALSSHNSFLQVALQVGLIGVILTIWQLWNILGKFSGKDDTATAAAATGYFIFTFMHAMTETFLTTNSFIIASVVWMNFGLLAGKLRARTPNANTTRLNAVQPQRYNAPSGLR